MPTLYLKRTFRLKEPSGSQKKKTLMMIIIMIKNLKKKLSMHYV